MRVFSGLEGSLEKYIEGFFKEKFGGRVQPVEIAKMLAREMRDYRRVSISKIYVPNEYTVYLNPIDWENVSDFATMLSKELSEYVSQKAGEKKYTLAGLPSVILDQDENLAPGSIRIQSGFSETPSEDEGQPLAGKEPIEHTQRFFPVKESIRPGTLPSFGSCLRVDEGPDQGKTFSIGAPPIIIGRRQDCDIVLSDTSISRSHARLDLYQGRYVITDLGSTNGVIVNNVLVKTKALDSGDVIILGTTVCTFKVE